MYIHEYIPKSHVYVQRNKYVKLKKGPSSPPYLLHIKMPRKWPSNRGRKGVPTLISPVPPAC